jgi:hypothetical protein
MAGVLEMIRWPQKRSVVALGPLPRVDPKILELQAAKEILAEVFQVRVSDVEEMILSRYEDVRYEENSSEDGELWPKEFLLERQDSQSPA